MKTCRLDEFIQELTPWLSRDYIRKAYLTKKGDLVLEFLDGVKNGYHIEGCTEAHVQKILKDLKKKGVDVGE